MQSRLSARRQPHGAALASAILIAAVGAASVGLTAHAASPAGFPKASWRVFDAVEDGDDAFIWINADAAPLADAPPVIEVQVNGGPWRALAAPVAGLHALDGLMQGRANRVSLRAVQPHGPEPAGAPKTIVPTAASDLRFLSFADEEPRHRRNGVPLSRPIAALGVGGAAPTPAGLDRTLTLPGGGELTVSGPDERRVVHGVATAPLMRFFDPQGGYGSLPPGEVMEEQFDVIRDGARETGAVVVAGAAGLAAHPAISVVAIDTGGAPLPTRFDRVVNAGRHPDGRPWISPRQRDSSGGGEIGVLLGDGGISLLRVDRTRPWRVLDVGGALVTLTLHPGLWPPAVATDVLPVRLARPPSPADPDLQAGDDGAGGALTIVANYETLHLYLDAGRADGDDSTAVRFRRPGGRWRRAQPLDVPAAPQPQASVLQSEPPRGLVVAADGARFSAGDIVTVDREGPGRTVIDARPAGRGYDAAAQRLALSDGPRIAVGAVLTLERAARWPGRLRGVIRHLAPDAMYEVEVTHAGRSYRRAVRTRAYAVPHVLRTLPPARDGVVMLNEGGSASRWLTYADQTVRGGVFVNAPYVELRSLTIRGAARSAIELGPRARHVRIIDVRASGWSYEDRLDSRGRPDAAPGWSAQDTAGIFADGVAPDDVLVMGAVFGSPRIPANVWEERNPRVREGALTAGGRWHPRGSQAIQIRDGGRTRLVVTDSAAAPHPLRNYNDGFGGTPFRAQETKGFPGPSGVVSWNYVSGAADDLLEIEGLNTATEIAYNFLAHDALRVHATGPAAGVALSPVQHGPVYAVGNLQIKTATPGHPAAGQGIGYKLRRDHGELPEHAVGRVYALNETAAGDPAPFGVAFSTTVVGRPLSHLTVINGLFQARRLWGADDSVALDAQLNTAAGDPWPRMSSGVIEPDAKPAIRARPLANVTDDGPFASTIPRLGARGARVATR